MGITDDKYGDLQQWFRRQAATMLGPTGGELVSRGLTRAIGVDTSGRMGMDSLLISPFDMKSMKPDDIKAYVFTSLAGAPASMLLDYVDGAQALRRGDISLAAEKFVPIKMIADSIQAARLYTEGRKSASGRQTMPPISAAEAALKVVGFTSANTAEQTEQRSAIMGDQQAFKKKRATLKDEWVNAAPEDRMTIFRVITMWNADQPKAAQITPAELWEAAKSRAKETGKKDLEGGVRTTSRDRHVRENNSFFNVGR